MAVFSTNQNRQLYVVKDVVATEPKVLGDVKIGTLTSGGKKQLFFKYLGHGGVIRTDLIDVDKVCYARLTKKAELQRKLKKATISLDANVNGGNPIVGQDYIVRILIHNYLAPGDTNVAIKHGAVHAVAGMTPAVFYQKLAKSLEMNFSREVQPLLTFEATDGGVVVTEVVQPYVVGFMAQEPVNFEVIATTVRYQGDDVIWATRDADTEKIELEDTDTVVGDGSKIADLEHFCMGERGDQYRDWVGAPKRLPVKYMVDPSKEYDVLDMHYFFSDTGVNVQKSEKDITFVSETVKVLNSIKTELGKLGITVQEKA